jgi:predicted phage terminase large subunit-like protein
MWVDGICEKQTMDVTINDLFKFVLEYRPQSVGIEVTGQQGAFIQWLDKEQMSRNIFFNYARTKNQPGIRPSIDKLSRFNMVVPWFKAGKIKFPEEMKDSIIMGKFMQQLKLTTKTGIKGHDDCIDTISMLGYMEPWKPADTPVILDAQGKVIYEDEYQEPINRMDSYIV